MSGQTLFRSITTVAGKTSLIFQPTETVLVSIQKHSGGVVVVGGSQELGPIGSGRAIPVTIEPRYFILNANVDTLYVFAESEEEVSFTASPLTTLFRSVQPVPLPGTLPIAAPGPISRPVTLPNPYDSVIKRRK